MSKDNWTAYKNNEWVTPIEVSHSVNQQLNEAVCPIDHTKTDELQWDDNHCGLSYYNCPNCGGMFTFW